ncbi:uncharacterized protein LOC111045947 [Nilaparvata lugens]|uniref:uncharacterized protein LOC111045947 n=1 Tax=Nilaparvata lugens TaxID=108931 RepID=UPI00193D8E28|nr:uncharacterized protein LOC111045947 [Nilaparvata lugens]
MTGGQIKVDPCCPIIQNTRLGWIVFGKLKLSQPICSPNHANSNFVSSFEISNQLEKFWKTEELTPIAPLTAEEVKVEKHYNETTMRLEDGRFMVTLPRKDNFFTLGQSEFQARKRFSSLEKRLSTQPELKSQYVEFMREYQELNHMTLVDPPSDHEKVYYIPHHAVFKPDSTTTKLRVVFDASAKTNSGVSLNELLFKGPTVQPDLFDIVLRFHMHKIAFTADIAKMYRQVLTVSFKSYTNFLLIRKINVFFKPQPLVGGYNGISSRLVLPTSEEYLVTLQQKQKWTSSSDNIVVGTLVLLKDPGAPPAVWKLGRITEVIKGVDNKVRVVMVFTEAGTYKRAISSIAPLPLDEESESIASI